MSGYKYKNSCESNPIVWEFLDKKNKIPILYGCEEK